MVPLFTEIFRLPSDMSLKVSTQIFDKGPLGRRVV